MCISCFCIFVSHQAGLASIKSRVYKEIVGRYGFKEEFTKADAETMKAVFSRLREKYEESGLKNLKLDLSFLLLSYGSVVNYLESAGFGTQEQKQLLSVFQDG